MNSDLSIIYNSRLLETEADVHNFEQSLSNVVYTNDISSILTLCNCFDDDTNDDDVMFGLVHAIEKLYKSNENEGLYYIAVSVRHIINNAKGWVEILHYRILNSQSTRDVYNKVLSRLSDVDRNIIVTLLSEIKDEDPDLFEDSVNQVLSV